MAIKGLGPTGLLHIALHVPDMDVARDFYTSFGLEAGENGERLALRCAGRDQDQLQLVEGPQKGFQHVAFAIEPGSMQEYKVHLEQAGVQFIEPPAGAIGDGLWFKDPDGRYINAQEAGLAPSREVEPQQLNLAGNYTRFDQPRWQQVIGKETKPRRLGHSLVFTPDLEKTERFYLDVVGMGLTDRLKGLVTFCNTGEGDHHVFGFIQSTHPGFHHASFEVDGFDEIGLGAQQMVDKGYTEGFGLGRHTLGSNLFYYARDPWGSWVEYFSDIDQITCNWVPNDWEVPPASWSGALHKEFLENFEAGTGPVLR